MENRAVIESGRMRNQDSAGIRGMYGSLGYTGRSVISTAPLYQTKTARTKVLEKQSLPLTEREIVKGRKIREEAENPFFPLQHLFALLGKITLKGVLLSLLALAAVALSVILMMCNLEKTVIYGNTKYSQEQIESFITRGRLGDNTVIMALKYHHRHVTDIPFIDQIDIDLINASTVRVNIREKEIDASIFYNGRNVYISRDGIIQTVSGRTAEGTTVINGVALTGADMGERIEAENQQGMNLSLELLDALNKYGMHADSIDVDEKNSLTVSFGNVKVRAGKNGYDQKMFKLHQIVPYLEGRSGIISMTGYNYNGENIVLYPFIRPEVTRAEAAVEAVKANGDEKVEQVKPGEREDTGTETKKKKKDSSGGKETEKDQKKDQKKVQKEKPAETSEATGKKAAEKTDKTGKEKAAGEDAAIESGVKENTAEEGTSKEDTVKKDTAQKETVQKESVQKETVQEDAVQKDTVKENGNVENSPAEEAGTEEIKAEDDNVNKNEAKKSAGEGALKKTKVSGD